MRGFDPAAALFEERLDWHGKPVRGIPHRLMVQCRQLYVFAHATMLGWCDARVLVQRALASVLEAYSRGDGPVPYLFSVNRTRDATNRSQDAYAYAFLLLAFAWVRKLLGDAVDASLPRDL
jgi:mannose-6-phosphate isomerase